MFRRLAAILSAGAIATAACRPIQHEIARIPVPGSSLEVVLFRDEMKRMDLYRVIEHGAPVTELRLLGPANSSKPPSTHLSSTDGMILITWAGRDSEYFIKLDPRTRTIVADSNVDAPPPIGSAP